MPTVYPLHEPIRSDYERTRHTGGKGFDEVGVGLVIEDYDCPECGADLGRPEGVSRLDVTPHGRFVCDGGDHAASRVWIVAEHGDVIYDAGTLGEWS